MTSGPHIPVTRHERFPTPLRPSAVLALLRLHHTHGPASTAYPAIKAPPPTCPTSCIPQERFRKLAAAGLPPLEVGVALRPVMRGLGVQQVQCSHRYCECQYYP